MNARRHYNISHKQIHKTAAIQYSLVNNVTQIKCQKQHKIYQNSISCIFKLANWMWSC